jgi:hypothetical protein
LHLLQRRLAHIRRPPCLATGLPAAARHACSSASWVATPLASSSKRVSDTVTPGLLGAPPVLCPQGAHRRESGRAGVVLAGARGPASEQAPSFVRAVAAIPSCASCVTIMLSAKTSPGPQAKAAHAMCNTNPHNEWGAARIVETPD